MRVEFEPLQGGDQGVDQTISKMQRLVRDSAQDYSVREAAVQIITDAGVRAKDYPGEVRAIFEFVRDRIRYTKDPVDIELVNAPGVTLKNRVGDCDDKAVLLSALLEQLGHRTRFKVVGLTPDTFQHVYVEVSADGQWIALDPTFENAEVGFSPTPVAREYSYEPTLGGLLDQDPYLFDPFVNSVMPRYIDVPGHGMVPAADVQRLCQRHKEDPFTNMPFGYESACAKLPGWYVSGDKVPVEVLVSHGFPAPGRESNDPVQRFYDRYYAGYFQGQGPSSGGGVEVFDFPDELLSIVDANEAAMANATVDDTEQAGFGGFTWPILAAAALALLISTR